jgi:hypothetical protein
MNTKISGLNSDFKLPQTNVYSLLDDQLLIFLRSWNGNDVLQKVVDEVTHFLSAANADLEVTTPFEYLQNLSSVANKVRISVLLANDVILKSENKDQFRQGFELAIIFKNHNELAWSTVGRFQITAKKMKTILPISHGGQFLDDQVLLPVALLGIDRQPAVLAGSISTKNLEEIQVLSNFADMTTYWEAVITDFTAIND